MNKLDIVNYMDEINFEISQVDFEGKKIKVVDILINGRNLIEIIREVELPFAVAEGHQEIAGGYMGLWFNEYPNLLEELLSKPEISGSDKSTVLICGGCGDNGCWPLRVKITVQKEKVIWSDFEQPHRGPTSKASHWKYDELKPFIFDRKQCEKALKKIIRSSDYA